MVHLLQAEPATQRGIFRVVCGFRSAPRHCVASNNAARGALSHRVWMSAAPAPLGERLCCDCGLYGFSSQNPFFCELVKRQ